MKTFDYIEPKYLLICYLLDFTTAFHLVDIYSL